MQAESVQAQNVREDTVHTARLISLTIFSGFLLHACAVEQSTQATGGAQENQDNPGWPVFDSTSSAVNVEGSITFERDVDQGAGQLILTLGVMEEEGRSSPEAEYGLLARPLYSNGQYGAFIRGYPVSKDAASTDAASTDVASTDADPRDGSAKQESEQTYEVRASQLGQLAAVDIELSGRGEDAEELWRVRVPLPSAFEGLQAVRASNRTKLLWDPSLPTTPEGSYEAEPTVRVRHQVEGSEELADMFALDADGFVQVRSSAPALPGQAVSESVELSREAMYLSENKMQRLALSTTHTVALPPKPQNIPE